MISPRQFRSAAAPLLAAVALVVASCGGDGESASSELPSLSPDEAAADDGGPGSSSEDGGALSEAEMSQVLEDYRQCLLDALPPGSEVDVSLGPGGPGIDVSVTEGDVDEEAEAACEEMLVGLERTFGGDPEQVAARRARSEAALQCLADRGYESDGNLRLSIGEEGGINVDVTADGSGFDEAAYLEAERECLAEAEATG